MVKKTLVAAAAITLSTFALSSCGNGSEASSGSDSSGNDSGSSGEATAIDLLGLTVQPLDAQTVRQFDVPANRRGLLVTDVKPGGPAYGEVAEPENGGPDVLLELEGKPVKSLADLRTALKGFKSGDIVSLSIYNTQTKARRIERLRLGS